MFAPTSPLSRLSLKNMPPTTRSQTREATMARSSCRDADESSQASDTDSDMSSYDDEAPSIIRSPSKIIYNLEKLSHESRNFVRDVFNDPPKMAFQHCRRMQNTYAFQMTELVTRSIRIRAPDSGSPRMSCSCKEDENDESCPHLLWLLDQVLKQTLYAHDCDEPVTLTPSGYAEEMGDPFKNIADYHLDVLAPGLHCPLVDPESELEATDPTRVLESRELLSSLYSVPPENFRPDIFDQPTLGAKPLKRNDLERTIFRMLIDNHHFFEYFVSQFRTKDAVKNPFRKLTQRVDRVLHDLDSHTSSSTQEVTIETPRDVAWAEKHILGIVDLMKSAIFSKNTPLQPSEAIYTASTLVHILDAVVSRNTDIQFPGTSRLDRNIYLRLIGNQDQDFIIGVLNLLPEAASHFAYSLEDILGQVRIHGAPASYVERFRQLLKRLRASRTVTGIKRSVQGKEAERGSKRLR